jgi:hypothetical protein
MTTASKVLRRRLRRRTLLGGEAAIITVPIWAEEQDFPSRPVRILVPYSAGGTSDTAARLVADPLGRQRAAEKNVLATQHLRPRVAKMVRIRSAGWPADAREIL